MAVIVIVAHSPLASALRRVVEHLFPGARDVDVLDVVADADIDDTQRQVAELLARHAGAEVLLLADVFGATPFNAASKVAQQSGARLVAGVNVPMIWRAVQYRDQPLDELVEVAMYGAQAGIVKVARTRPQNQNPPRSSDDQDHGDHQQ